MISLPQQQKTNKHGLSQMRCKFWGGWSNKKERYDQKATYYKMNNENDTNTGIQIKHCNCMGVWWIVGLDAHEVVDKTTYKWTATLKTSYDGRNQK